MKLKPRVRDTFSTSPDIGLVNNGNAAAAANDEGLHSVSRRTLNGLTAIFNQATNFLSRPVSQA